MLLQHRCTWSDTADELMLAYHDTEWGVAVWDDIKLFEFLCLDGAQAGLSWSTVLKKRENYRKAFAGFDPVKVARFDKRKVESLMKDAGIIRNRMKIESCINNAKCTLEVRKEYGTFAEYLWQFVGGKPIQNKWKSIEEIPATSDEAIAMSKDMKRRGFSFVGPTICYAFMQAAGMVNDHEVGCFRYKECR